MQFSTKNPSLFVATESSKIDFFDLNKDMEAPVHRLDTGSDASVNRVRWNEKGECLAAGLSDGHVLLYDVGDKLATPRSDEWTKLRQTLNDIEQREDQMA